MDFCFLCFSEAAGADPVTHFEQCSCLFRVFLVPYLMANLQLGFFALLAVPLFRDLNVFTAVCYHPQLKTELRLCW